MQIDHFKAKSSDEASRLVDRLGHAGIEACQCPYEFDTTSAVSAISVAHGGKVERVAVLVHHEDRVRATDVAAALERDLEREGRESRVDDVELTRQAMEAGPPPDD